MRELTEDEVIDIRKNLLYEFHLICEKNSVKYSLGYGTLLGAVRHRGMIPWDDDIDVIVSREEFEHLCILFDSSNSKKRYQFLSHRNHPEIKTKIGYFIDYTTITETAFKTNDYHGVHIDVYPVDIVPNNWWQKKRLLIQRWFLHKLIRAKDIHPEVMHGAQKLIRKIVLWICAPFSYDKALDKLHVVAKKYMNMPQEERKIASVLVESGRPICFPYRVMNEYVQYDYDNKKYWGVLDYDSILTAWYGDYMTPPPAKEQHRLDHKFVHFYYKD